MLTTTNRDAVLRTGVLVLALLLLPFGCGGGNAGDSSEVAWPYEGFAASTDYERDISFGWIAAGQPSEARLREVVEAGARVINLRTEPEDPFDEKALVESLGGEYIRYPVVSERYSDVQFREDLYDLYDREIARGGPVYLHCASSNRVGASWALYHAERLGLPVAEAVELGVGAGLAGLTEAVRDILGTPR